ncbi:MAG: ABC transporter substrate-binding protein [Clostridia bacterium]|nr:ABC transporter substrate-binding protein [Clostridia bacterium]
MKKILTILLAFCMIFLMVSCKSGDKTKIRVNEVTHSIFYAPFYVAIEKGFFEEENIEIELTNGGGSDASMTALLSKSAEVVLLGPETGIYTQLGGANDQPVIFAQLTKRDGSFLVGRSAEPDFSWKNLKNKEIIAGRRGGMPAMALEYVCNQNDLFDGQNITLNYDVQFNLTAAAFEGGTGDYVTMFEPTASEYQRAGKGYIVASVGEYTGEVPYTCFMARQSYFDENQKIIESFTKAVYKAIKYIEETETGEVAKCLVEQFPSTSLQSIVDSINSYKGIDAWMKNMSMKEDAFNRLQTIMTNAGELDQKADFSKLVNNSISEKVYLEIFG